MKKFIAILMIVLSIGLFAGETLKKALNNNKIGDVWISGVVRVYDDVWKYTITDGRYVGFLDIGPNDIDVIMRTNDPTELPGASYRNMDGWLDEGSLWRWLAEEQARGRNHQHILLEDYRNMIRRQSRKNAQRNKL